MVKKSGVRNLLPQVAIHGKGEYLVKMSTKTSYLVCQFYPILIWDIDSSSEFFFQDTQKDTNNIITWYGI
jgi:hypothetical protein